jgi:hypothetical protein
VAGPAQPMPGAASAPGSDGGDLVGLQGRVKASQGVRDPHTDAPRNGRRCGARTTTPEQDRAWHEPGAVSRLHRWPPGGRRHSDVPRPNPHLGRLTIRSARHRPPPARVNRTHPDAVRPTRPEGVAQPTMTPGVGVRVLQPNRMLRPCRRASWRAAACRDRAGHPRFGTGPVERHVLLPASLVWVVWRLREHDTPGAACRRGPCRRPVASTGRAATPNDLADTQGRTECRGGCQIAKQTSRSTGHPRAGSRRPLGRRRRDALRS